MVGKIFITRSGYDPQLGKHVKDPYLGPCPTLGACRPDVRKQLTQGDHIFVISGKIPVAPQYVMAGFEVAAKIDALTAFQQFPEQRLHRLPDERDVSQQYKTQPIAIGAWCLNSALRIVQSDSRRGGSTDERVAISSITRLLLASITDLTSFKLFGFKLG